MADPKAYESEKLTSGVTWKWKKTISDYPASEWTLTYYLRKDGAAATSFSASADGDTHLVTVTAATTAGYAAGVYDIIGVVVKSAEKYVVYDGIIEVLTNPASGSAYDPRSHARRVLDLIEAAMEGRIPKGMESYTIGRRSGKNIGVRFGKATLRCSSGGVGWFSCLSKSRRLPEFSGRRLPPCLLPWICTPAYATQ
ncbi:MAG: hypothetical protein QF600_10820 [Verrucomicrobiota bacterium]|jgi:hypothetical protein|nr:hypothetical protein [Verrucomicrobiota bacterium]